MRTTGNVRAVYTSVVKAGGNTKITGSLITLGVRQSNAFLKKVTKAKKNLYIVNIYINTNTSMNPHSKEKTYSNEKYIYYVQQYKRIVNKLKQNCNNYRI